MPSSQTAPKLKRPTTGDIVAIILLIALTAGIVLPLRAKAMAEARLKCIANLKQIDGAKSDWDLDSPGKRATNPPTDADLFGKGLLLPEKPVCPVGGTYTIGALNEKPRCSIPGHTI